MTDAGAGFHDPDIQAMLRFKAGDEQAFDEIVRKHQKNVLNLVYRYLSDATQAEDVAQEAFIRVYRARANYEPSAKFSTWLYRITVNLCLNEIRSRKSAGPRVAPVNDLLEEPAGEHPDSQLDQRELQQAVKDAIDALPENQRMAVLLARYEDMSYDEIAEAMNLSLEAVKSALHRAKENLKQKLARFAKR